MELNTGMNQEQRAAVSGGLNKLLADLYILYLKTQNFHWNVSGPEFFSLHKLFEVQYEELAEEIDEVAERIRALGFYVDATTQSFRKLSSIPEEHRLLPKHEMLRHLVEGHEQILREARHLAALAEKHQDPGTVDLVGRRMGSHEKMAWMLRSQL